MALIKCKECGAEVSDKASACVKCGAPLPKKGAAAHTLGGLGIIGLIVWIAVEIFGGNSSRSSVSPAPDKVAQEDTCKKDDLQCLGDKGVVGAGIYCKEPVEHMATHSVKWTDGTFETKFSRFRWLDQKAGSITYVGDKAQFQNGFGAYTNVVYECDMADDNKTVLSVRVREGFLQ